MPSKRTLHLLMLPDEILLRIRFHLHTLQDHVYFSRTCRTIRDLYDEDYFKFALTAAGWGRSPFDWSTNRSRTDPVWRELAGNIVADARAFETYGDIPKWATQECEPHRTP